MLAPTWRSRCGAGNLAFMRTTAATRLIANGRVWSGVAEAAGRGAASEVATSCLGTVTGFGVAGYALALRGLKDRAKAQG